MTFLRPKDTLQGRKAPAQASCPEPAPRGATRTSSSSHLSPSESRTGFPRGRHLEPAPPHTSLKQVLLDSLTLAASVVIQQDVARGTGAEICARLVHTLVLAEELREAALVHIWG